MHRPPPRVVVVTRKTEYELLLEHHSTRGQAEFFLGSRELSIDAVDRRHRQLEIARAQVAQQVPAEWRRNFVLREDLAQFLFEPEDVVVVVGQDGLVANVAKYLDRQPVIGVNPAREEYEGILVPHPSAAVADLLRDVVHDKASYCARTMVEARSGDGQCLRALNEIFIGHRTHQSARYRIRFGEIEERQSSSGLIVTTGTGATGWARSINLGRTEPLDLPAPEERRLGFFVREAFPATGLDCNLTQGSLLDGQPLCVTSELERDGIAFGDGIESDPIALGWGEQIQIFPSDQTLQMVV